ncbi:DUF4235 domain-containing protein [Nocardioides bruguierae]|uniref:DUF4235 domain-containing protein n=1 Tax=Nocardioides bruguierae TaxID=2945102 RepID=A0A9X2D4C5_9ACTN|nr:DUF4235 domain-containing protein [Nocardioides bruguierae]MCL8024347.1 DUF4235 domain-containing protein [Nocardioides bruguierae]MCM0618814.1 DUF4235 domain-containing protein [Nocardioides bruguierae]
MAQGSKLYSVGASVSAIVAAQVARKVLTSGWQAATRKQPPANPADPDVEMWEAVAWAVSTGAVIAVARMLAQRRVAEYYRKSTGELPPSLQADSA